MGNSCEVSTNKPVPVPFEKAARLPANCISRVSINHFSREGRDVFTIILGGLFTNSHCLEEANKIIYFFTRTTEGFCLSDCSTQSPNPNGNPLDPEDTFHCGREINHVHSWIISYWGSRPRHNLISLVDQVKQRIENACAKTL